MTPRDARHAPDDDLRRLLTETAESVEPADRLTAIRGATGSRRSRVWLAPLAAAATVAVVAGAAALGWSRPWQDSPDPLSDSPSPGATATEQVSATPGLGVVPVYFVGDTPSGPRLYREFQQKGGPFDLVDAAVSRAVTGAVLDPDYRSAWPAEADAELVSASPDLLTVSITGDSAWTARPAGMSEEEARLAVQQVVYSAQAAFQSGTVPVQLLLDGQPVGLLLGVPASEPLDTDPILTTVSLLNISTPGEGQVIGGDVLKVSGRANTFEGTVVLELFRGEESVRQKPIIADGTGGDRLWSFKGSLSLTGLSPGTYVLKAWSEDASGQHEALEDTKTITIS